MDEKYKRKLKLKWKRIQRYLKVLKIIDKVLQKIYRLDSAYRSL
jgi:hypothetical protein